MKNFKLLLVLFLFFFSFIHFNYAQISNDELKPPQHNSDNDKIITTGGPKSKPSLIKSLVSNANGMHLKFTNSEKKLTRISVFRKDMEVGNFIFVKAINPNNKIFEYSFTDSSRNLERGREYCYLIKTWIKGQGTGTPSKGDAKCHFFDGALESVLRPENPRELEILDVTSNSVTVTFKDQSNNEKYFFLERKEPHHSEWLVTGVKQRPKRDRVKFGQIEIKNTSLEMEQSYHYRVRAVNNQGSSLSNTVAVKTYPLDVENGTVKISHPSKNILQIAWRYDNLNKQDWEVSLYNIDDNQNPIRTNQVKGNEKRMTAFTDLDPTKQYCIGIRQRGSSNLFYRMICDSPFAERTLENQKGPIVPTIQSIERISSSQLEVNLRGNGREGQLIDLTRMSSGERRTLTAYRDGRDNIHIGALNPGENFCIRLLTTNTYGTRYSSAKCQATILDPPRKPYITNISESHVITVEWTSFGADEHTFQFTGTKAGETNHTGNIKMDPPYNYILFQAKPNYSYCFKVKSKNKYDTTDWSPSLCGIISEEAEEVISFSSFLIAEIPESGNIIYLGKVAPGNNSRLRKVHVAGNSFTPYIVQFLPTGKTREDCGTNVGVFIEPGEDLEGDDLNTLYGSNEPKTPVFFGACKLVKPNKSITTSRIPIKIDYVKE